MISFSQARLSLGKNHLIVGKRGCGKTTLVKGLLGSILRIPVEAPILVIVYDPLGSRNYEYSGITPYVVNTPDKLEKMLTIITTNPHIRESYHKIVIYENEGEPSISYHDTVRISRAFNITNIFVRQYIGTETLKDLLPYIHHHFIFQITQHELQKTLYHRIISSSIPIHTFATYLRILSKDDYEFLVFDNSRGSLRFSSMKRPRSVIGAFFTPIPELKNVISPSKSPKTVSFSPCERITQFLKSHNINSKENIIHTEPLEQSTNVISPYHIPTFSPANSSTVSTSSISTVPRLSTALDESVYPSFEPHVSTTPTFVNYRSTNPFDSQLYDMLEHMKDAMRSIQKAYDILEDVIKSS
jgi:energy-coupling factor transporter ATP-binding protein EcfA2